LPIPLIVGARSLAALLPTLPGWALSPSFDRPLLPCDLPLDITSSERLDCHLGSTQAVASRLVSVPAFARLRADARAGGETRRSPRQPVMVTVPGWCAPASAPGLPGMRAPAVRVLEGTGKGLREPSRFPA
jgi:hypothetical protein